MKTSFKASLIALAIASFPLGSQAASLGQINVFSGLGQPLRAEIAVSATPQELQSLSARIGSVEAFRAANLPFSSAASAVRVSLDTRGGRPLIRLSSVRPINDPFMELLVELNWASGQLSREYTFLLDPVDLAAPKPVTARAEAPAAPSMPAAATPVVREPSRVPAAAPVVDRYTVRRGDTLRSIAASTAPAGASLEQMLVALFRANPGAFDGANINRLRAGAVLSVPSADRVQSIDAVEARREIVAQSADFEAYRRRLAGSVAARPAAAEAEAEQASGGRVVPKVEEARQAADSGDKVRVSRSAKPGEGDAGARLQALEEELATREKALQDANQRLAQLEQSIRDMQKLLEVRSASLAQAQQQAGGVPAAGPAPSSQASTPTSAPAASEAAPATAALPEKTQEPAVQPAATEAAKPAVAEEAPKPEAAAPKPAAPRKVQPPPPAPEEPGFLESVMGDPTMLAAGGGVIALLLALAGLKLRQRRAASAAAPAGEDGAGEVSPVAGKAVFGETGGQSVDTGASMLMTDFSQSGLSAIDTDEGVDPVAEADVYMAYGRDAQAEEILQDAMKVDPERAAIYLKLLEIYAQRKSVKQFETVATDLYARTGGRGADWERAAAMGRKLDPENPLYGERAPVTDADMTAPVTEVPLSVFAGLGAGVAAAAVTAPVAAGDSAAAPLVSEPDAVQPESLSALDFTSSMPAVEPSHSQLKDTWTRPGELAQFSDRIDDEAGVAVESAPEAELPATLDVIDFDLGIDETPVAEAGVSAATGVELDVPVTGVEPDVEGLTFDLDVGELSVGAPTAPVPQAAEQQTEQAMSETVLEDVQASEVGGMDFDLAGFDESFATATAPDLNATMIDVSPAPFEPETTALGIDFDVPEDASDIVMSEILDMQATVVAPESSAFSPDATALDLDFDLPDLDLDLDLGAADVAGSGSAAPGPESGPPATQASAAAAVESKADFDEGLLDFDFDLEPHPVEAGVAPSLDLTSIDLNLDGLGAAPEEVPEVSASGTGAGPQGPLAANHEEIETKIELARAYEEMGDKEGALELLDEVVREGSAQQQAVAREIVARLG
ncbi:MAG: hypothetical protein J0M28_03955 [Thauera sp.]|nr:hypothetical protein [Thauera sp.]